MQLQDVPPNSYESVLLKESELRALRTAAGVADALGAVAAAQPLSIEDLKESCHAAKLVFQ